MAYALVGTIGAVSTSAAAGAVTPAFGAGESRTAGNLLICFVLGGGGTVVPATPAGWSSAASLALLNLSPAIFYKIATGGDAAPTIAGAAATTWQTQLAEFSGNASASPLDKFGTASGGTSPLATPTNGIDAAIGELVVYALGSGFTSATTTMTSGANNWTAVDNDNDATVISQHYLFGYGFTTANAAADRNTFVFNDATNNGAGAIASFKAVQPDIPYVPRRMPLGV